MIVIVTFGKDGLLPMLELLIRPTRVQALFWALIFVTSAQSQTLYRKPTPTALKLSATAQGDLTGTSVFSLSPRTLSREAKFSINPDTGLLHILCTWELPTPLTVSLTRAAGHGLPGTVLLVSHTSLSPIALEIHIEPEQATRGPIYVEVTFSPFGRGDSQAVHGTVVATLGTTAVEKVAPQNASLRNNLQEGKLLAPSEVTAMEAELAKNPGNWTARLSLLGYYGSTADLRMSRSQIIAARRHHILWAIENRATESGIFDEPELQFENSGPRSDPDGAKQAEQAWQRAITRSHENTQVNLNAAIFSATTDPAFSEQVLRHADSHAENASFNRTLGWVYATALVSDLDRAFAEHAHSTLMTSTNPDVLLGAAPVLASPEFKVSPAQGRAALSRARYLEFSEDLTTRAISSQPDNPYIVWTYLSVLSVDLNTAETADQRLAAEKKIYDLFHRFDESTENPAFRLLLLPVLAGLAFDLEDYDAARKYATQSLDVAGARGDLVAGVAIGPQAIHDSNDVLGRIALHEQKLQEAKDYLLRAAETSGGGILSKIGPRMLLAQALLDRGERDAVIEYLQKIKVPWQYSSLQLDQWITAIRKGKSQRLNLVDVPILASYR
jgi:tetratricopeptide (TPR) repeat protein